MLSPPPFETHALGAEEGALNLTGSGQFNHIVWRVDARGDHAGIEAQVLTLHEWSHNELNNVSVYGCLLTAYAQLSRHAKTDRDRYRQVLNGLVNNSRRAHEIYATWYSTDMFLMRAELADLLALYPQEYQAYFAEGSKLVEGIDSSFLRQQAFLCAVRICFSNAELAERGGDLVAFRLADVRQSAYPSAMLDQLNKALPRGFFNRQLEEFLLAHQQKPFSMLIRDACAVTNRGADFFQASPQEADTATMELHQWYHEKLTALMADQGVACAPYGYHLLYFKRLLPQLTALCEESSVTHPLVPNAQPHDNAVNLLLHMENEVFYVRPDPLPCVIRPVTDIPRENWQRLATGEPAHFFFCVRYASQLLAQHHFPDAAQRDLLQNMTGPLLVLRRRGRSEQGIQCEMFLFKTPQELQEFRKVTEALPAYSSIAMSALADHSWCDRWLEPAMQTITGTILFDQSLFHTLKDGWPQHSSVKYAKGILTDGDVRSIFLVFLAESKDGTYALYLSPCSELFVRAMATFIKQKLSPAKFVHDESFMHELTWLIPPVVSHLLAEEHYFSFNQIRYV